MTELDTVIKEYENILESMSKMTGGGNGERYVKSNIEFDINNKNDDKIHTLQNTLEVLTKLDNTLPSNEYTQPLLLSSVTFSVILITFFVSYKLINNSITYKNNLFNGKLFGESICT